MRGMTKNDVFQALLAVAVDVVPELCGRDVQITERLRDLGANSVDRAEILMKTMSNLRIQMPLVDLAAAENIEGLVDLFLRELDGR